MASVALHSKSDEADQAMIVTTNTFRAWKKRHGRHTGFVVQMPGADTEDDGILVCTFADMCGLPAGNYQAQLVKKRAIPKELARKELLGCDLWECI